MLNGLNTSGTEQYKMNFHYDRIEMLVKKLNIGDYDEVREAIRELFTSCNCNGEAAPKQPKGPQQRYKLTYTKNHWPGRVEV